MGSTGRTPPLSSPLGLQGLQVRDWLRRPSGGRELAHPSPPPTHPPIHLPIHLSRIHLPIHIPTNQSQHLLSMSKKSFPQSANMAMLRLQRVATGRGQNTGKAMESGRWQRRTVKAEIPSIWGVFSSHTHTPKQNHKQKGYILGTPPSKNNRKHDPNGMNQVASHPCAGSRAASASGHPAKAAAMGCGTNSSIWTSYS